MCVKTNTVDLNKTRFCGEAEENLFKMSRLHAFSCISWQKYKQRQKRKQKRWASENCVDVWFGDVAAVALSHSTRILRVESTNTDKNSISSSKWATLAIWILEHRNQSQMLIQNIGGHHLWSRCLDLVIFHFSHQNLCGTIIWTAWIGSRSKKNGQKGILTNFFPWDFYFYYFIWFYFFWAGHNYAEGPSNLNSKKTWASWGWREWGQKKIPHQCGFWLAEPRP